MKLTWLSFLSIVLVSCSLEDNTFIYDPFDPRLPQYSEEGANTAGALIDGSIWIAQKVFLGINGGVKGSIGFYCCPADSVKSGTLVIIREGVLQKEDAEVPISVGFFLEQSLKAPGDLSSLEGQEIILDGEENFGQVFLDQNNTRLDTLNKGVGVLHIRDIGTNESNEIYISGTFGFKLPNELAITEVFSGRFDYEVSLEQFREVPL